jgi:hypothetical protein
MVKPSRIGNILVQVLYYGFMESVSATLFHTFLGTHNFCFLAGAGKSVLSCVTLSVFPLRKLIISCRPVLQSYKISTECAQRD